MVKSPFVSATKPPFRRFTEYTWTILKSDCVSWLAGSVLSIFLCPQTTLSETLEKQPIENIISIHPLLLPPWLSIQLLSCVCLCDPLDCSPQGSLSRAFSQPRKQTSISCIGRQTLYHWATKEAHYLLNQVIFLQKNLHHVIFILQYIIVYTIQNYKYIYNL